MSGPFPHEPSDEDVEAFIARWSDREGGQERANYALFLIGLTRLLGLPEPDPSGISHEGNDYVFERAVPKRRDAGDTVGRIDLYRRGSFVLEAKQSRVKGGQKEVPGRDDLFRAGPEESRGRRGASRAWDVLMLNAKRQAEDYARALPASHGWPPFILVCDVGHVIEVFADFTGQGKNYTQYPDRQGYRIYLEDLRDPNIRKRLRLIWLDPTVLDLSRIAARATRAMAARLAAVSRRLEQQGHDAEEVAHFLMRCLFTMFSEDVGLLPETSFKTLLAECSDNARAFPQLVGDLWRAMDEGSPFAISIRARVLRFNGSLFRQAKVLPLGREEIGELAAAAAQNWREVEPAIFGTLLEQALDPGERRRLGAHYTPRAYVERLVVATVIEPLRSDWLNVQNIAEERRAAGDHKTAAAEVAAFHRTLCETRILDPACGTGNFLYVALELMKKLEAEVLDALVSLGGQEALAGLGGHSVDPHQFLGLELNPRAAAIAELVLWIGYLQQHLRTKGGIPEPPILKAFRNIQVMNAVLTSDGYPAAQVPPASPRPLYHAAGKAGPHGRPPPAGEETLPDPPQGLRPLWGRGTTLRVVEGESPKSVGGTPPHLAYPTPRRPEWPTAEFIVGNPPFIGKGAALREAFGEQVEALWAAHRHINPSADFVMYWWDRAADILTRKGTALTRFGFVTTNSITQEFSGRVMKKRMEAKTPVSLVMAIPDHPWTKATPDAAAVRIAMTVVQAGTHDGVLREVVNEDGLDTDQPRVAFVERVGRINPDLTLGANVSLVTELRSNRGLSNNGMLVAGRGFILTPSEAASLTGQGLACQNDYLKIYRNGRDLITGHTNKYIIDLFGLSAEAARNALPRAYHHLLSTVKPVRESNNRASYRNKWWIFAEPRSEFRPALMSLNRYIATTETAKHRTFQFIAGEVVPDHMIVAFASDDATTLGVLSSRVHVAWSLAAGGWLGIGNDPRYSKSRAFDPFPFPDPDEALKAEIRAVAEELDAFRKARQAEHAGLTLTGMYNVLEKLKAEQAGARLPLPGGERRAGALTPAEERIKEQGLVLILRELHERLDALVFRAYCWPETLSDDEILERLVALNRERGEEERRGFVRWLRPEYQIPRFAKPADRQEAAEAGAQVSATLHVLESRQKPGFPARAVEQSAAVFAALAAASRPVGAAAIASGFRQGRRIEPKIAAILASAARIGAVSTRDGTIFSLRRAERPLPRPSLSLNRGFRVRRSAPPRNDRPKRPPG